MQRQHCAELCARVLQLLRSYSQEIIANTDKQALLYSLIAGADIFHMDLVQSKIPLRSIIESVFHVATQQNLSADPQNYTAQVLASLINKWPAIQEGELKFDTFILSEIVNKAIGNLKNSAISNGNSLEVLDRIKTASWIVKALIMSPLYQDLGFKILQDIIHACTTSNSSLMMKGIAAGFGIIIGDSDILSPECHARVKVLYKQRFFTFVLPIIVERSKLQTTKQFAFLCLPHLIKNVTKTILISEMPTILPLIISSLSADETDILDSSLTTIKMLLQEYPDLVFKEFQITDLADNLLQIMAKNSEQDILLYSLECLQRLADFALSGTQQHKMLKQKMTKSLEPFLDNRKRLVRKQAAKTRNKWFSLTI
eukprot:CAMPEP_0168561626 /NCGR_PEP_ID=MMETSP0413-20121227/11694_1 /TAXON_ID=136452 /ORGANISM="Filamoeba nolandi, Strain NC-AS-23-1" /LENGTH=369 /DNA_ID=CAMNT_0008593007 /DNA_START=154 /DNA_END=1263 /DNA_ORIENTATION=+